MAHNRLQRIEERAIFENLFTGCSIGGVRKHLPDCRAGRNWREGVKQGFGDALGNYWFFRRSCCYLSVLTNNTARLNDRCMYLGIVVIKTDLTC